MAITTAIKWFAAIVTAATALTACSHTRSQLDLLDSRAPGSSAAAAIEQERLKQLELVRVTPVDANGKELPPVTVNAEDVKTGFQNASCGFNDPRPSPSGNCRRSVYFGQQQLCIAHQLLGVVQPNPGITLKGGNLPFPSNVGAASWRIKAQSPGAKVALARVAKRVAAQALENFEEGLAHSMGGGIDFPESFNFGVAAVACPAAELADFAPTLLAVDPSNPSVVSFETVRDALVNYYIEAYNVIEEAAQNEADTMVAYGDFQRANPSITQGIDVGVLGSDLSRAAAVHKLVGGGNSLKLTTVAGQTNLPDFRPLCTRPSLSPGGRLALDIMRQAALSPADVLNTGLSINALINGGTAGCAVVANGVTGPCGSVKQRLVLYAKDTSAASTADIQVRYGLSLDDFTEARDYLREEYSAYRRYRGQMDPASTDLFPKFGATATPPSVPNPAFYRALASGSPLDPSDLTQTNWSRSDYSSPAQSRTLGAQDLALAEYLDIALSRAQVLLASPVAVAETTGAYRPLAAFVGESSRRRLGRMMLSVERKAGCDPNAAPAGCAYMRYRIGGTPTGQGYRLVVGDEAMECMTKGLLDGYSCALSSYRLSSQDTTTGSGFGIDGFSTVAYNNADDSLSAPAFPVSANPSLNVAFTGQRVYLLRPRTAQTTDVLLKPGDYETIGAGVVPAIPATSAVADRKFGAFPMVPELDQKARDLLAPSKEWCTHQLVDCSHGHFDERLPLENELTRVGNPSESSWKHYLELARVAAKEADALGSELVQHGIDLTSTIENQAEAKRQRDEAQRSQVEQAVEQLQNICGTSVDPRTLLAGFSSDKNSNTLDKELPVTSCSPTVPCATNFRCYGGRCIVDSVAVAQDQLAKGTALSPADAQRLVNCLGDDTVVPFVTVGTQPMCIWYPSGLSNEYCAGSKSTGPQCPAPYTGAVPSLPSPLRPLTPTELTAQDALCMNMTLPPGKVLGSGTGQYSVKLVTDTLNFFDNSGKGQIDPGVVDEQCGVIPLLRAGQLNGVPDVVTRDYKKSRTDALIASNRLHVDSLKLLTPIIGWEPTIGGFSSITVGGEQRYTTGKFGAPASTGWPCDKAKRTGAAGTLFGPPPSPDFAVDVGCGNDAYRAYINQRMRDAVMAAQATTIGKFKNISWPANVGLDGWHTTGRTSFGTAPGTTAPLFRDTYAVDKPANSFNTFVSTVRWNFWQFAGKNQGFWSGAFSSFAPVDSYVTVVNGWRYPFSVGGKVPQVWDDALEYYVDRPHNDEAFWWGAGQDGRSAAPSGYSFMAMLRGTEVGPTFDGWYLNSTDQNDAAMFRVNPTSTWDAAELMCALGAKTGAPPSVTVSSAEDLDSAATYLEQTADYITSRAGRRVLAGFSKYAKDAARKEGATGAFPTLGGEMSKEVSALRSNLIDFLGVAPKMASELRLFALDIKSFRGILARNGLERDINDLQQEAAAANNLAECANALMDGMSVASVIQPGKVARAGITCANSLFQTVIGAKINAKKNQLTNVADQIAFAEFGGTFEKRSQTLRDFGDFSAKLMEEADRHLAELDRLRGSARRALDHAIVTDSFQNQVHYQSNDVMRRRLATDVVRYGKRLEDAKRLSFLAKRAIEQRIGIQLSEMTYDLPLVEAPSAWEPQACILEGVDFSKLIDKPQSTALTDLASTADNYATGFIGDYVDKLEKVVESYVLTNNFHEGSDTAVISLKEDVVRSTASCEKSSRNLLSYTDDMSHLSSDSLTTPGWEVVGCATQVVSGVTVPLAECVSVIADSAQALKVENNGVPGFLIRRGPQCITTAGGLSTGLSAFSCGETGSTVPVCPSGGCGLTPGARLRQRVSLGAGIYRISYYTKSSTTASGAELFGIGGLRVITDPDGSGAGASLADGLSFKPTFVASDVEINSGYKRVFADFSLSAPQIVSVEVGRDRLAELELRSTTTKINPFQTQTLTGIMLENVTRKTAPFSSPFARTGATRTYVDSTCADVDGAGFRSKWARNCLSLCNAGYGDACSEGGSSRECFWEIDFPISQRLIESGRQLTSAGFAKGNFNYRIHDVAVNFVGTGLRDCSRQPQSCNGAGFVQYSLSHQGPFFVRNHFGGTFEAHLFDGNIEHARGLGTERYITNPISSTDSGLLSDYLRGELNGRPLDGNFVLRIWERPDLDLSKITDVQVVMKYGYWTRFN